SMAGVPDVIIERALTHFERIHPDYAEGVRAALNIPSLLELQISQP
ncbi:MAG: hypothetical protein LDL37_15995, partial [Asticcacaulis sp.]|nr:hypothetical protein [Asticcacaulis sp.]